MMMMGGVVYSGGNAEDMYEKSEGSFILGGQKKNT